MRAATAVAGTVGVLAAALTISGLPGGSAQAAPKPQRHVSSTIVERPDHGLVFRGKVFGSRERPYDNRITRLQKKTCRSCDWQVVRRERTNDRARFGYDVGAPRRGKWFFRVAVPPTREYRTSYSRVWFTKRA